MAKRKVTIDIEVNGKMQKATIDAKKLEDALGKAEKGSKKASKATGDFQRGLKGVGEQSANATKNFSKFSQGMQGFVAVYATLAAQIFAVSAAFNFLKRAGDLQSLEAGQQAYAGATGTAMNHLTKQIQAATRAQIEYRDAAQAGAIGVAAGLSADQLTRLGKAAADSSQILGRDVTDSFNRLVRGVTKAEPELLDELGIILRLNDATAAYARELGKDVNSLTQFEKSQAVANDVLTQAEQKYGRIIDAVGAAPNPVAQLGASFDELIMKIQKLALAIAGPLIEVLKNAPAAGIAAFAVFLAGPLKTMGFELGGLTEGVRNYAKESQKAYKKAAKASEKAGLSLVDQKKKLQSLAEAQMKASKDSAKSKILQKLARGEDLSGTDKANLKKALDSAKKQLKEFGEVRTGIFAGSDAESLKNFKKTLKNMEAEQEKHLTRMQKIQLRATALGRQALASIASGLARVTNAVTTAVGMIGKLSIAFIAIKSAVEFYKGTEFYLSRQEDLTDEQKAAEKLRKEYEESIKGIIALGEEYKNFVAIQREVRREYDKMGNATINLNSTLNTSAAALANLTQTTFSPKNIDAMRQSISELNAELANIQAGRDFEKDFADTIGASGGLLEGVFPTMDTLNQAITGMIARGFREGFNAVDSMDLPGVDLGGGLATTLSEDTEKFMETINIGKEAYEEYFNDLKELGADTASYPVFDTVGNAIIDLANAQQELAQKGDKLTAQERQNLNDIMSQSLTIIENNSGAVEKLGNALANVALTTKAAEEAYGNFANSVLKLSSGQQARKALEKQIEAQKALLELRKEKGFTTEDEERALELANARLKVTEDLIALEQNRKLAAEKLRKDATRNYDRIENSEAAILRKSDQVAQSKQNIINFEDEMAAMSAISIQQNGEITKEVMEQLEVLQAKIDAEKASRDVLLEQEAFLKRIQPIQDNITNIRRQQQFIDGEKTLLDIKQKEFNIRQQILRLDQQMRRDQMNEAVADAQTGFFADDQRIQANARLELARQERAEGKIANEQEYQNKLAQINLEYQLLDAKREQTAYEFQLLAEQLREKGLDDSAARADALASDMLAINYDKAKSAAIELALKAKEAADYGLDKAVRDAERAVDALDRVDQVLQSAADAFVSSLNDAVNAMFDSLYDETLDLNEKLKEIGRNFLQTIQKAATEKLIIEPLLDAFFPDRGSSPTKPMYVSVVNTGATTSTTPGGTASGTVASTVGSIFGNGTLGTRANPMHVCISENCGMGESPASEIKDKIIDKVLNRKDPSEKESVGVNTGAGESPEKGGWFDAFLGEKHLRNKEDRGIMGVNEDGMETLNFKKVWKGSLNNFIGSLKDIFNKNTEGGFIEKLGVAFEAGGIALGDIFKGFGNMFGDLLGGLLGGGGAGGLGGLLGGAGGLLKGALSLIPGIGPFAAMLPFKNGGIMDNGRKVPGYASGGIANGSQQGHLAMLHGKEAIVPLGNGNSIPVQMQGAGGQQNNVSVSVNIDNKGNAKTETSGDSKQAENIGSMVASAVQKELQNQKRAGGILSPYGNS